MRRAGRITKSQQNALSVLWPQYGLTIDTGLLDYKVVFDRITPVILEIGFGMGDSLVQQAVQNPDKNYIGIEVHRPGVGTVLSQLEKNKLENVRIFCADANDVLKQSIPAASLDLIQIFFPDPWHKKRHNKRRLIQPAFVEILQQKLKPNGKLHLATDWEDYAMQMMSVMETAIGWKNVAGKNNFSPRPEERPLTKFELRGQRLGHGVWDLIFVKL